MSIKFTDEQLDVIEDRGRELLVSAAAGSGKTAVLIERIYRRVMDEDDPVDIDRFVVVTYTNAAAAEMKDRLRKRMESALSKEKLSREQKDRLRNQIRLIPSAHVSTVHSFCSYIIGQCFHGAGIDPSFTIASEAELKLIFHEVAGKVLEEEYEKGEEDFDRVAKLYSLNRFDTRLEEWLSDIYKKVLSEPFPDLVLENWEKNLTTPVTDKDSPYIPEIIKRQKILAGGINERAKELCDNYAGEEEKNYKTIVLIKTVTDGILDAIGNMEAEKKTAVETYEDIRLLYMGLDLKGGLPKDTPKNKPELAEMCEDVKPLRQALEDERDSSFISLNELEKERQDMSGICLTFLRLTRELMERYSEVKRERGIADFNDLEQFALRILYTKDKDTGRYVRSDAAKELSLGFKEIMIDEYQDSNRVQDTILWAVSDAEEEDLPPWECLSKNRFMVGDIKQSIYRFRNACPELFEGKMKRFKEDYDSGHDCLFLNKNFRSAKPVINAVNEVFSEVMHEDVGGVEYDGDELEFGATMPEIKEGMRVSDAVEVDDLKLPPEVKNITRAEATHIARRIIEMVEGDDPLYVRDGDKYRPVRYKDIVILSRAVNPIAHEYTAVFEKMNIPFYTRQQEGFYGSREILMILQMLSVIDNPRQDIPLAGVLLSPMFGLTEEMLAVLQARCPDKKNYLYDRLIWFTDPENHNEDEDSYELISGFLKMLYELRQKVSYISIEDLVAEIFQKTGIYDLLLLQPDGERRCANLDYLMYMVSEFDKGSYRGVHAFIEYTQRIISRDEDEGEPFMVGEDEDVVRLMSIHKSKGLEFPVVFIPRMVNGGNSGDSGRFVMDTGLGIAGYIDDVENGIYKKPVIHRLITSKSALEDVGELFRLFYVGMTRAKDHLVLVCEIDEVSDPDDVGYFARTRMKTFLSMIRSALRSDYKDAFRINEVNYEEETVQVIRDGNNFDTTESYNDDIRRLTGYTLTSEREDEPFVPAKISVSELKMASMEEEGLVVSFDTADDEPEERPGFMREKGASGYTGAERGTIVHQVMATIDFTAFDGLKKDMVSDTVQTEFDRLVSCDHISREELSVVAPEKIAGFFESDLADRMVTAAVSGKLRREQPFILNKRAAEIKKYAYGGETPIMIQGIIDGYFEEDDGIVLMDYKTDRISSGDETELTDKYHVQMELYKEALEKLLGKNVKECYLYSFYLGREIKVNFEGK